MTQSEFDEAMNRTRERLAQRIFVPWDQLPSSDAEYDVTDFLDGKILAQPLRREEDGHAFKPFMRIPEEST